MASTQYPWRQAQTLANRPHPAIALAEQQAWDRERQEAEAQDSKDKTGERVRWRASG